MAMKKQYLIIHDYTHGSVGFIVNSSSKKLVYEIYGNNKYYEIVEGDIANNPLVKNHIAQGGTLLEYDIKDLPEGLKPKPVKL